jgi:dTDP-4-dehydrorhamnose reductase
VDKLVIAGVDTILGGNIAAWFSDRYDVVGFSFNKPVRIAGCETLQCPSRDPQAIQDWIASERPKWTVFCGPWTESAWNTKSVWGNTISPAEMIRPWAAGSAAIGGACTIMSSDAVFTSPWMFHDEESVHFCESAEAQAILEMERTAAEANPDAMIVRSHVFGWSPTQQSEGFIEQTLAQMYSGRRLNLDCVRHATPILATDLAEVLEQGYGACLSGLYHIGGAERLNPYRLGTLLANQFGCPYTPAAPLEPLTERAAQFGAGETSLQSLKIRKALGISLPLVSEGLVRLHAQSLSGFRDQFGAVQPELQKQFAA